MGRKSQEGANPDEKDHGDGIRRDGSSERDYVMFFSRLTRTLEKGCGRDALAESLATLRQAGPEKGEPVSPLTAFSRVFRRLGLTTAGNDSAVFLHDFTARVGEAVNRPAHLVRYLLRLFAMGDEDLSFKAVCGATPDCRSCDLTRECDHYNVPRKPEMASLPPAQRLMDGNDYMLSDHELLAVLLFGERATGKEDIVAGLMRRYGRLSAIYQADFPEFMGVRDLSRAQALRMAATTALHSRLLAQRRGELMKIGAAKDIYARYAPELRDYRTEAAVLLLLDGQHNVLRDTWFCGTVGLVHLRIADLLRPAVQGTASAVALVHNHPGNDPTPSLADAKFTRDLRQACNLFNIRLVDHVIVAESGYYSFAENGRLEA